MTGSEPILAFQGEYRFLSNFWPCQIIHDGIVYPSAEHVYQAQKTRSRDTRKVMSHEATAGKAKRLGQTLKLRMDWHEVRLAVMHEVVTAKFSQNSDLAELLIATGDRDLVEGNSWGDSFWGRNTTEHGLVGENWLGKILTITRSRIILLDQG